MNALQRQTRAAVDLGLLTRVLCHELNNLVANQRGYARLLTQRGAEGAGQRWLAELATATEGLQGLLASVQQWSRRSPHDEEKARGSARLALQWPPAPGLAALAARLSAQGCALSELALSRVLAIVADHAAAEAEEWGTAPSPSVPPQGALTEAGAHTGLPLGLRIPDRSGGRSAELWAQSAGHILPPAGSSDDAWLRALVLAVLRQNGADLIHLPGAPDHVELWMPRLQSVLDRC